VPLAGTTALAFVMLNVDYVVVGRRLGPVELGLYLLAFNLSSWPVNMFSLAVRRVAPAGFSKLLDDPDRLHESMVRAIAMLMAVTMPLCGTVAILAPTIIRTVYGERWSAAAVALRWLIVLGGIRVAAEVGTDFLVAAGRSKTTLWIQGLWTATLVPTLVIGAGVGGIEGVAAAHALVALMVVMPAMVLALARYGVATRRLAVGLAWPMVATVVTATGAWATQAFVAPALLVLVSAGALTALAAGATVMPMLVSASRANARP
jgi:PST family polysaccharide transporter